LVRLHSLSEKNLDLIRVNNPSFDPLAIVIRSLQKPPSPKTFNKNVFLNLVLYTRSLRYDQSIVRCPDCNMLIPRDMSPNNFKQVIEIYDPMPPDSPIAILAQILATGPKKQKKGKLAEYITGYQQNYYLYLKDYATFEKVKSLLNTIDTKISAELGLQTNSKTEKEVFHLEQAREKS
jgi:Predicted metal-dependent hydrolases with the TIM-barrel fold